MKVVDANVLIYAASESTPHHRAAQAWLSSALAGGETVGLPWVCLLAFIRLTTNARIFPVPVTVAQSMAVVESWLSQPGTVVAEPTARHPSILGGLLAQAGTAGNLTTDAHVAAIAIEHGATVVTFDRDFERFGAPVLVPT